MLDDIWNGATWHDQCFFELSKSLFKILPRAFLVLKVFLGLKTFLRNSVKQALRLVSTAQIL